jgi:hypothetical protein
MAGQLLAALPRVLSSEAFGRRPLHRVYRLSSAGIRNPYRKRTFGGARSCRDSVGAKRRSEGVLPSRTVVVSSAGSAAHPRRGSRRLAAPAAAVMARKLRRVCTIDSIQNSEILNEIRIAGRRFTSDAAPYASVWSSSLASSPRASSRMLQWRVRRNDGLGSTPALAGGYQMSDFDH